MRLLAHPFQEIRESLNLDVETFSSMLGISPQSLSKIEAGLAIAGESVLEFAVENELVAGDLDDIRQKQTLYCVYAGKLEKFKFAEAPGDTNFIKEIKDIEKILAR